MVPFVNIHTHRIKEHELSIVNMSFDDKLNENVYYSFGIHPWYIGKIDELEYLKKLNNLCAKKKIIAIGEIGIDKAIETSLNKQKEIFFKQLDFAQIYKLPVIIHNVRANSNFLQIRKTQKNQTPWILHGFVGSTQDAIQFVNKHCFISFGKYLFTSKKLQLVINQIPLENIFFETDDSDISIEEIYKEASQLLKINIENLKKRIYSNFNIVFQ